MQAQQWHGEEQQCCGKESPLSQHVDVEEEKWHGQNQHHLVNSSTTWSNSAQPGQIQRKQRILVSSEACVLRPSDLMQCTLVAATLVAHISSRPLAAALRQRTQKTNYKYHPLVPLIGVVNMCGITLHMVQAATAAAYVQSSTY